MQKQTSETVRVQLSFLSVDVSGIYYHEEPDTYEYPGNSADFEIKSINIGNTELLAYTDEIDCFYQSDLRKEYGSFQDFLVYKVLDLLLY